MSDEQTIAVIIVGFIWVLSIYFLLNPLFWENIRQHYWLDRQDKKFREDYKQKVHAPENKGQDCTGE
ncbi:MAG: hypothetical protein K6G00_05850 [Treponema sp.]|nr:hypothetical protein [Treponema sp.]